jgi:hypothetical protein
MNLTYSSSWASFLRDLRYEYLTEKLLPHYQLLAKHVPVDIFTEFVLNNFFRKGQPDLLKKCIEENLISDAALTKAFQKSGRFSEEALTVIYPIIRDRVEPSELFKKIKNAYLSNQKKEELIDDLLQNYPANEEMLSAVFENDYSYSLNFRLLKKLSDTSDSVYADKILKRLRELNLSLYERNEIDYTALLQSLFDRGAQVNAEDLPAFNQYWNFSLDAMDACFGLFVNKMGVQHVWDNILSKHSADQSIKQKLLQQLVELGAKIDMESSYFSDLLRSTISAETLYSSLKKTSSAQKILDQLIERESNSETWHTLIVKCLQDGALPDIQKLSLYSFEKNFELLLEKKEANALMEAICRKYVYYDTEKVIKDRLIQRLLEMGAPVSIEELSLEYLEKYFDLLLKKYGIHTLMQSVSEKYAYDDTQIRIKDSLIERLLEMGAPVSIEKFSLEYLEKNFELLLKKYGIHTLVESLSKKYPYSDDQIKIQDRLIERLIEIRASVSIEKLSLKFLEKNFELLLEKYGIHTLMKSVSEKYAYDEAQIKIQDRLIERLLEMGASVSIEKFSLEYLEKNFDLLLEKRGANALMQGLMRKISNPNEKHAVLRLIKQFSSGANAPSIDINKVLTDYDYTLSTATAIALFHIFSDKITPTAALMLLARSESFNYSDSTIQRYKLELVKDAIDAGADVNFNICGDSLLHYNARDKEVSSLLAKQRAECYSEDFEASKEAGLDKIMDNPHLAFIKRYKNLNAQPSKENKVPYELHHIWLTNSQQKPEKRKLREEDIARAIESKAIFAKSHFNGTSIPWKHILWVNNIELIGNCDELANAGFEIRDIHDPEFDLQFIDIIDNNIAENKWGIASDFLRYIIIEKFGGIYADINFVFNPGHNIGHEVHTYNFFTISYGGLYIDNFFFGASPQHPVVKKMVELVHRNLTNPPKYIARIFNKNSPCYTDKTTADPTHLAYSFAANQDDNVDVVYPLTSEYGHHGLTEKQIIIDWSQESEKDDDPIDEQLRNEHFECEQYACPQEVEYCKKISTAMHKYDHTVAPNSRFNIGSDGSNGKTWMN